MALIDKETIRTEIERRLKRENEILWNAKKRGTYPSPSCEYNLLTLTSLRDFLDSLPEQVNGPSRDQVGTKFAAEGLEEATHNYVVDIRLGYPRVMDETDKYIYNAFKAGAEWQKSKDQELIELAEDHAMLAGMNKMEQQMLDGAVEGRIGQAGFHNSIYIKEPEWCDTIDKFNDGDKVRVIVIKDDEK